MILWKHRQNSIISFISPKLLSVSYEAFHTKFHFRRLVLLEMTCFEKIIKRALQKFAIQCKYSWYKIFVHLLLQRLADSVLIAVGFWFGIASIISLLAAKILMTDNTGTSDACHLYWKMHYNPPHLLKTRQTHGRCNTFWHCSVVLWGVGGRSCQRRQ